MSTDYSRAQRVGTLIRRELAPELQRVAADERLGLVTLTAVDVSPDLRQARIFVTSLGTVAPPLLLARLEHYAGRLRHHLAGRLGTRVVPRLVFRYDESAERAARLGDIFRELRDEETGESGTPG